MIILRSLSYPLMAFVIALGLAACAKPVTTVETTDERPQIAVSNAGEGAVLIVNGVTVGPAQDFDGTKATLRLDKGTHVVEIAQGGTVIHQETVFLADGVKRTIVVR